MIHGLKRSELCLNYVQYLFRAAVLTDLSIGSQNKNHRFFALIIETNLLSVKTITPTSATLVDRAPSMCIWTTLDL